MRRDEKVPLPRSDKPRILWVAVEPTPYLEDEFEGLERELPFAFKFIFLTRAETQPWEAHRGTVLSRMAGTRVSIGGFLRHLISELREPPAAVVLEGYGLPHFVVAAFVLSACQVPYVLRGDTPLWRDGRRRSVPRSAALAWVVRHASWLLPGGTRQMASFRVAGAEPSRMSLGYMTVEGSRYAHPGARECGQKGALRLVSVGRLVERKRMSAVIDAVRRARERGLHVDAEIVGDGPERERLWRSAADLGGSVTLSGFKDSDEVAKALWRAEAFILLASDEPWGLVVNEALAAGLPVILDREIGCVEDLLQDGINGFRVDENLPSSVDAALLKLALEPDLRLRMGRESAGVARRWGRPQRNGAVDRALRQAVAGDE